MPGECDMQTPAARQGLYRRFFKRPLDFLLALAALIILAPFLLILAILVRVKLGRPVLFKQKRPGCREKIFTLYKFRTMTDKRDANGALLPDDQRLPRFGRILRSTSLDELPELFNILKGDMSIIGPRPLLVQYLPLYNAGQKRRHEVRPGLSGLAQVNGRNAISWEDRFDLDVQYVDNITLAGDCRIICQTVKKALIREGINQTGEATMAAFTGSPQQGSPEQGSRS